jgi:hypothetical protein
MSPNDTANPCRLFVMCCSDVEKTVTLTIRREASQTAIASGSITVLGVPRERASDVDYVTSLLNKACGGITGIRDAVIIEKIQIDSTQFEDKLALFRIKLRTDIDKKLTARIQQLGLDWFQELHNFLRSWSQEDGTGPPDPKRWITQFKSLGPYEWIGIGLLKELDFWTSGMMSKAFDHLLVDLGRYDAICVNESVERGKSAGFISGLVSKRLGNLHPSKRIRLKDLHDAIEDDAVRSILFLEDCMITGNELTRMLSDLQGAATTDRSSKAKLLLNPHKLREKQITIAHALTSNWAMHDIPRWLQNESLSNIVLSKGSVPILETLTPEGLDALSRGQLLTAHDLLRSPGTDLIRPVFRVFRDAGKRERAVRFCAELGRQLIERYYTDKEEPKIEEWLVEGALGIRSHALALAFFHSVPKETLPLFWMSGPVLASNGQRMDWNALFTFGR